MQNYYYHIYHNLKFYYPSYFYMTDNKILNYNLSTIKISLYVLYKYFFITNNKHNYTPSCITILLCITGAVWILILTYNQYLVKSQF